MELTDGQKQEAQELFKKGYSASQVFRHFGAQSVGEKSEIDIEQSAFEKAETTPAFKPLANKITGFLGLDRATETFGDAIARTRLGAKLTGADVETNRQFIEAPTGKELLGAGLQTAAVAASPAIAPAGLGAQIATGAGLGYAYDVGNDLLEGKGTAETLTPGLATGLGAIAPPVIRGGFSLFKKPAQMAGETLALPPGVNQTVDTALPSNSLALRPAQETTQMAGETPSALGQTVRDFGESVKRVGKRIGEKTEEQALKAQRLQSAPPNVAKAINADIDDTIIDFVTTTDDATKKALRDMVTVAESPKKMAGNARPTQIAEDYAVQQYKLIEKTKKEVGSKIGDISEQFDTLKNIDVTPTQNELIDVMRQNGITLDMDGNLVASNNLKITDEQMSVINKLFNKVTKQNTLSAKNLHELDQWFSTTQRQSRLADKIEDVYITVPTADGTKEVNLFKVFRDAFGKRLDEVAPEELRALNRQYRQYSNFLEDIEGKLVSNPEFSDLVSKDGAQFAEAGLRRIFGEGKGAADRELIYNAMDRVSRELGYEGPRADELYSFGEELKKFYPETVQKTSFRGQIGASIMDKLGSVVEVGKVTPKDQQEALKALLEMTSE